MGTTVFRAAIALLLSMGVLAPVASAQSTQAPAQDYALGAGDVIEVNVLGRDDFKTRARIRPDGTILLPFLGAVSAAQRTPTELSGSVAAALRSGGYYSNPVVSVDVVSYASQYVTVLGAVTTPGLVPIDRAYRLSEIMARVGGTRAGGADYVVLRPATGQEQRFPIKTLATGDLSQDPLVSPGDKIYVPDAELFYIYGEVNSPGAYPIMSEPTLRKALARGGGVKPTGTTRRLKIYRQGQKVEAEDLAAALQPGDVIVVGERLF
jgi:polysaccharide export outer membrane protein